MTTLDLLDCSINIHTKYLSYHTYIFRYEDKYGLVSYRLFKNIHTIDLTEYGKYSSDILIHPDVFNEKNHLEKKL